MESFRTNGTCSRQIIFEVDDSGILTDLKFLGGCAGGLQALSKLTCGKNIDEVISICQGIQCKNGTSCPDQLAQALKEYKQKKEIEKSGVQPTKRGHPQVLRLNIKIVNINKNE